MKLLKILNEISGLEQVKSHLEKKSDKLSFDQQETKRKIAVQKERIKRQRELEKSRSKDIKTNECMDIQRESRNVSQVLKWRDGSVLGYIHEVENQLRYFDKERRLVAVETNSGTFSQSGKRLSHQPIGLFVVGVVAQQAVLKKFWKS